MQKNGILGAKTYTNPTSYTLSYTLSYTRKCLQIQDVGGMGVGNVGFYSKTFFVERGRTLRSGNYERPLCLGYTIIQ